MKRFLGISSLTIILSSVLYFSFPGRHFDMKAYDIYSSVKGSAPPHEDIVIVGIDEESFSVMDIPWPWPRSIHGHLIKSLRRSGAKVIAMDIIFSDPSTPEEDNALASAIRQHGNVVLAADVEIVKTEKFTQSILVKPFEELLDAGASFGVSSIPVDSDNVVRRIFWGTHEAPSLEIAVLDVLGIKKKADYRKMLRFADPDTHAAYVPYYKALQPDSFLPEGFFKDKIVIVGKYTHMSEEASTSFASKYKLHLQPPSPVRGVDMFATPFYIMENKLTHGIEIHASMIAALLRDDLVRPLKGGEAILFIALLSAFLSVMNYHWRPLKSISLNIALSIFYIIGSYYIFSKGGLFLPFMSPLFAIFINFVSSGVLSYVGVEKKRRYLRSAFALYLSPQVAKKVLDAPEKLRLGGERVTATILFSDLAGFTEISENIEPEEVVSAITRYATDMTKIIFRYNGTLDKFIGDAIMAVWGTPVKDDEQAYHACLAAIDMQRRMRVLADEINIPGYRLSMRIGINTGPVMAGNMGSEERFDFTVIGDNVNIASRLEPLNKIYGTEIIISESTMEGLGNRLNVRELDLVRVKGKKKVIKIYELLDRERSEFDDIFEEGLGLYQKGDFKTAHERFIKASGINPEDKPCRLFIERCDYLLESPPREEWNGVWNQQVS